MKDVSLLIVIRENVVQEITSYASTENLEEAFVLECEAYGVEPCDENFDDGYLELEDGTTICMASVEVPTQMEE